LLVLMGLSAPSRAQPFRTLTAPPGSPSPEAQRAFQARIAEQARLLANDPRVARVPRHRRQALVEFVVGNVLFVATHEMGHAVVLDMNLPTLGGAEQAADDFAILTTLKLGEKDFSDRVLIEAAKGWFTNAAGERPTTGTPHYYERHGLNARRAYRMVCLMVGADSARFDALAAETTLPKDLRRTCGWDYDRTAQSWERALTPFRPAADQPKPQVDVKYAEATGPLAVHAQIFRNLRFLETIAAFAADRFGWRAPIAMEMRSCGSVGAAWTVTTRTLHICYEMVQDFAERCAAGAAACAGPRR
jgi:hypothetical protein